MAEQEVGPWTLFVGDDENHWLEGLWDNRAAAEIERQVALAAGHQCEVMKIQPTANSVGLEVPPSAPLPDTQTLIEQARTAEYLIRRAAANTNSQVPPPVINLARVVRNIAEALEKLEAPF